MSDLCNIHMSRNGGMVGIKHMILALSALFCLILRPVVSTADAQPRPAQSSAQLGPTAFLDAALAVVSAVDRFEMASVWDRASPIMQSSIPKDRFVTNTAQRRALLGNIHSRDWTTIMRAVVDAPRGGELPAGRYISVRFKTYGSNGLSAEEVVSFHFDTDGRWKLSGYSISENLMDRMH